MKLTYGRARTPLSAHNARIVAQRQTPPLLLGSTLPLHPRDARLAATRQVQVVEPAPRPPCQAQPAERLLALLQQLAVADAPLPNNDELGEAAELETYSVARALQALIVARQVRRLCGLRGRAVQLVESGLRVASRDWLPAGSSE